MTIATKSPYNPIDPDFEETLQQELQKSQPIRIHYFTEANEWGMEDGTPEKLEREAGGIPQTANRRPN